MGNLAKRAATDPLRGYFYQFENCMERLLDLPNNTDSIVVEGIEDIDVCTASEQTAVQCKYYSKTEYNHSVIGKPIRFMLSHYSEIVNGSRKLVKYLLYGNYESGQEKLALPFDTQFLKDHFLTYTKKGDKYEHHTLLGLDDNQLEDFLSLLTIDLYAKSYEDQNKHVLAGLKRQFGCSDFEAEHFYYNNALAVIKHSAIADTPQERTLTKKEFVQLIDTRRILFNVWYVRIKSKKALLKEVRKEYFSNLNISPFERFFLVEIHAETYSRADLKDVLLTISKKWSNLSKRTKQSFCPYVYLHGLPNDELIAIKTELFAEGHIFNDGYDFCGADFCVDSIIRKATGENRIKLKCLNKLEYLDVVLRRISKTKEVYEFFLNNPFFKNTPPGVKHITIQYEALPDIKEMI